MPPSLLQQKTTTNTPDDNRKKRNPMRSIVIRLQEDRNLKVHELGRILIRNEDLEELREVGSGTFGIVYHGKWRGSDVAIKRIKKICFAGRYSEQERLVECPYIYDPTSKYISLIIPAYNEELRLPVALDETMNYLQERAGKDPSFTYEGMLHSRGKLLLMLDANGATKVDDLAKLENQVPETLQEEVIGKMSAPPKSDTPIITPNDLPEANEFV